MQIRPLPESATVYADLTSSNGKINTTSAATGLITLSLSSTDTDAIPIGSHHFDLIRTDTTLPMVIGRANVQQGVTR